ncbi:MAG: hypothetical protein CMM78_05050 [Rhodospirillaceae bacterium]|uniref:hypothetical protein n=1 Tax=unclassified Hwanghaeella TaxID=2605944 RepID=UPI000C51E726|nr:hypothetical protein [Rhodospirillales bacterium]MAX47556.1 hypothetical protein [Rhodospirillaceae bacterium]
MPMSQEDTLILAAKITAAATRVRALMAELSKWLVLNPNDAGRNKIQIERLELAADLQKLEARLQILMDHHSVLQPPTQAQIDAIGRATEEVSQLNAQQASADALISASNKVINIVKAVNAAVPKP